MNPQSWISRNFNYDNCSLILHLADSTIKKPMGIINDVIIVENRNYVPIDFIVLNIDCNPSCPITSKNVRALQRE